MSKIRKRQTNLSDADPPKSTKKYKKTPDRDIEKLHGDGKSSKGDSDFPAPDSSLNDVKTAKKTKKQSQKSINYEIGDIKSLDISQLLDLGEGKSRDARIPEDSGGTSDTDEEDWEEVKMEEKAELKDPVIPREGVNIILEVPGLNAHKRKKKGFDLEAHIKRQMNQVKRELQVLKHKVHVLCWIAHLKFVNTILNSEMLMGVSLSLISSKNLYPPKYADLAYLERIVKWFHSSIELKEFLKNPVKNGGLSEQLCHEFGVKTAYNKKHYVLMMIVLLRTLGLKTRLVMSFQVVPVRPKTVELYGKSNKSESFKKEGETDIDSGSKILEGEVKIIKVKNKYFPRKSLQSSKLCMSKRKNEIVDVHERKGKNSVEISLNDKMDESKLKKGKERKGKLVREDKRILEDSNSDSSGNSKHFMKKRKVKTASKNCDKESQVAGSLKGKTPTVRRTLNVGNGKAIVKKSVGKKKMMNMSISMKNKILEKANESSDTDSDFVPQSLKKTNESDIDRRVFSSDDEEEEEGLKKKEVDVWAEVFLEAEEKWITVDAVRQKIHCVQELYSRATQPVVYVVACNNDSTLKDVTKRYVPNWHSDTRKRRVDEAWWNETIWPFVGPKTAQDKEEDEDINRQLLDKPLPAVIAEYKDHPLYALKRHLLKFEGIYPPEAPTLGFVRGEPVYARECVVTLHSREVWYKEARVVRLGEQPYKIVKARPKFDKMTGEIKKDLPLELFGFWQTDVYIPPIATDGKVPRNEYGNVDLFKPCMLPKGTVHLQIPALNKVAKKLGIDCAAAVVGFEFHSGASHPLTDGFVVCEEFKDILLDAWTKEMEESNKKSEEKRLKRVYDNWKRLIRGLLIREKLKIKYDFGVDGTNSKSSRQDKRYHKQSK